MATEINSTTKEVKFNRATKDFDCYLNGRYIGSRASRTEAQTLVDQAAFDALS